MTFHELAAIRKGHMVVVEGENYMITSIEYGYEGSYNGITRINKIVWTLGNLSGEEKKQFTITKTNGGCGYYTCIEPYADKPEFDTVDMSGFLDSIPLMEGA